MRFERLELREMMAAHGDFNGDGFDDLAVGVPGETINGQASAGAVSVIYGTSGRLDTSRNQFWHQDRPGVEGSPAADDQFGAVLAAGDFNGDGFDDLAIGVPNKSVNEQFGAGAVNVLYGSSSGLRSTNDQLWHQDSSGIGDTAEINDHFGSALAVGDFNNDGRDDLAIGSPNEDAGAQNAGAVTVIYGSSNGLTSSNDQFWHQDSSNIQDFSEVEDHFGATLAAGDFNGDGRDDLAVGVPDEDLSGAVEAGAVNVLYGSSSRLSSSNNQFWHQDSSGVADSVEMNDKFGKALAVGDFNNDGRDELAIGAPGEGVGESMSAGRVHVLYGSSARLKSSGGSKQLTADALGFVSLPSAQFGSVLAVGDFNGNGREDLAIGAPSEDGSSGAVYVAYGSTTAGLEVNGAQHWRQIDFGDTQSVFDQFGQALSTGDYNGDGRDDLAIGIPGKDLPGPVQDTGAVRVLYGRSSGLTTSGRQLWRQSLLSNSNGSNPFDKFGAALG